LDDVEVFDDETEEGGMGVKMGMTPFLIKTDTTEEVVSLFYPTKRRENNKNRGRR